MRPACSVILVLLLAGCAATTSRTTDDATTSTRVKIALLNDARVGGLRLEVKTFQGVVTLSGTVKSRADEQAAIGAARTIQGVRDVKSELKIEGSQDSRPHLTNRDAPDVGRERAAASEPRARACWGVGGAEALV